MAKGIKTGGRQVGTPNNERKDLLEMLAERYPGYHPVISMADIANNQKLDQNLRFQANKEVAKYISPQLKAMGITIIPENKPKNTFRLPDSPDGTPQYFDI